ncbi:MAG: hypothetical protein IID30_02125 [Planctomycetes bacterium]|nr:hypothetical protein [Planctomycetota bacterium]
MHWTAILEKRQFPPHARINGDLDCIGCGYNLRGALAGGLCSECGLGVSSSLFELARPDDVASGFRSIAMSYLPNYMIFIAILVPNLFGMDMYVLVGLFLLMATLYRMTGVWTLRFRGAIAQLPRIGPRLNLLFIATCLDLLMITGCLIFWYVLMVSTPPPFSPLLQWKSIMGGIWLLVMVSGMFLAGQTALSLATMLEYEVCRRELLFQQILIAASPVLAALLMGFGLGFVLFSGFAISSSIIIIAGTVALALILCLAIVYTSVSLLRLSGAAAQERETMDHLVDTERVKMELSHTTKAEEHDIRLE